MAFELSIAPFLRTSEEIKLQPQPQDEIGKAEELQLNTEQRTTEGVELQPQAESKIGISKQLRLNIHRPPPEADEEVEDDEEVNLEPQAQSASMPLRLNIFRPPPEEEQEEENEEVNPEKPLTPIEQIRQQLQRGPDGKAKVLSRSQRRQLEQELSRLEQLERNPAKAIPLSTQVQQPRTLTLKINPTPELNESSASQSIPEAEGEQWESSESEKEDSFNNDLDEMFKVYSATESGSHEPTAHDTSPNSKNNEPTPNNTNLDAPNEDKIDEPTPSNESLATICTYTFKKNSRYHQKGDPCENLVAKHPKVGGENMCCTHQPKDADYPEDICEHKRHKGLQEINCPNPVSHDGTPDGERFCDRCIALRKAESEKLNRKPVQRGKCPNVLQKGVRKGKVCNNPLPRKNRNELGVCTSCARSKRDKTRTTSLDEDPENTENDQNEQQLDWEARCNELEECLSAYPRGPLKLVNLTTKQIIKKNSKLDKILPEHWKFVLETLACKDTVPSDMAQVLFWRAHHRFRYNSLRDTVYWEKCGTDGSEIEDDYEDDDEDENDDEDKKRVENDEGFIWEEIPIKRLSRIQQVKDQLFRDARAVLEEVEHIFNNNALDSQLNRIRTLLGKSAAKPLTSETFELFLDMLYQSKSKNKNMEFRKLQQQKKSVTLNSVKAFVEARIKRSDGPQKRCATTSDILIEYNKWRQQQQNDAPELNTVSFGIALAKINEGNQYWSYGGNKSNRYHHIEFQTNH